jgi:hypothetical protein
VPADVTRNLAAAGRVPDHHCVAEVERIHQRRKVVGVGIHIVAVPGLVRTAVAPRAGPGH